MRTKTIVKSVRLAQSDIALMNAAIGATNMKQNDFIKSAIREKAAKIIKSTLEKEHNDANQ